MSEAGSAGFITRITGDRRRQDALAILWLTLLWALFFWRILTPDPADQVAIETGDFSEQFYVFGEYQSQRLLDGEIPLWNPHNYGGNPFLADPQSGVFYLPRLITILLSEAAGSWSFRAITLEAVAHIWLASIMMYMFISRVTKSSLAGIASAIIFSYGGFLAGYPITQLPLLESAIWLPLALLGVHNASGQDTGNKTGGWHIPWLIVSGVAVSLSLFAGHPQTTLFIIYAVLAYGIHRAVRMGLARWWTVFLLSGVIVLGFGLAAVRMIPGFEFIGYISRGRQGFDWYANGFPFADLLTFILPNTLTRWSPLYSGVPALFLAVWAFRNRYESARFWGYFSLSALVLSFGGSTILYDLAYLVAPGFAMFRGQERAAFLVAFGVATLAGLGVAALEKDRSSIAHLSRQAKTVTLVLAGLASAAVILEMALPEADLYAYSSWMTHSVIVAALVFVFAWLLKEKEAPVAFSFLILLVVFDLFAVSKDSAMVSMPQDEYPTYSDLVESVPGEGTPFRVDGSNGLWANNATLVGLRDIRGRNPMNTRANSLFNKLPVAKYYDLMCVAYVFTDWQQLEVPSTIVDSTDDGAFHLHAIEDPAPCAAMVYQVMETPDEAQALGWIADPSFNARTTAVIENPLPFILPQVPADGAEVVITSYQEESIEIDVSTPENGLLVISEWDYPGWKAYDNGSEVGIIRVNAGQRGLALEAGKHAISLVYEPLSYRVGLLTSVVSVITSIALAILFRRRPAS